MINQPTQGVRNSHLNINENVFSFNWYWLSTAKVIHELIDWLANRGEFFRKTRKEWTSQNEEKATEDSDADSNELKNREKHQDEELKEEYLTMKKF